LELLQKSLPANLSAEPFAKAEASGEGGQDSSAVNERVAGFFVRLSPFGGHAC